MQQVIIAIHLMVVIALVALVLYQKSEGGALGIGQSGLFSGRGQANALTRATGILGTIFFVTSILLTVLPAWERRAAGGEDWTSAVDSKNIQVKEIKPAPGAAPDAAKDNAAPEANESVFEQLKRAQEKRQAAPQSSAPQTPAPQSPANAPSPAPEAPALRPTTEAPAAAPQPAAPAAPEGSEPAKPSAESPKAPTTWAAPTK